MKFILAKKIEMTQRFAEDGTVTPVTVVQAGPCVITQIKTVGADGYAGVQLGFGTKKRLTKSLTGHAKDLGTPAHFREFRVDETGELKRGDVITAGVFTPGDPVQVIGTSKGKGYAGVVKRHGFHGAKATHGNKDQLRTSGSIGATDAARVFKGTRMAGQMGDQQVTITGLSIVDVDTEHNLLYIKGAIPGSRNGLVLVSGDGEMKLEQQKSEEPAEKTEAPTEEKAAEEKPAEQLAAEEKPAEPKEEESEIKTNPSTGSHSSPSDEARASEPKGGSSEK